MRPCSIVARPGARWDVGGAGRGKRRARGRHAGEGAEISPLIIIRDCRFIVDIFLGGKIARVCLSENREENRGENREESACGALLRALHAPGGADEERIARGCPASMCTAP